MEVSQIMEQISANEEIALNLYNLDPDTPVEELIKAVQEDGINNWHLNLQLLQQIKEDELDEAFANYIDKIYHYTGIRQETYRLILKAIEEDTDKYDPEIEEKDKAIQVLVDEIEAMVL